MEKFINENTFFGLAFTLLFFGFEIISADSPKAFEEAAEVPTPGMHPGSKPLRMA